jgi:hypothetical protein
MVLHSSRILPARTTPRRAGCTLTEFSSSRAARSGRLARHRGGPPLRRRRHRGRALAPNTATAVR